VLTTTKAGDYFDNGSVAHFSHVIDDLFQFYATPNQDANRPDGEPFAERVQYMFRGNQLGTTDGLPADGNSDQFTDGGGPAFIDNVFQGTGTAPAAARDSAGQFTSTNATLDATFTGAGRIGHEAALQQASRAADGTPLHIRMDGPGFDGMDVHHVHHVPRFQRVAVAAGSNQFKLQFIMFVPTADLFAQMRPKAAAQDPATPVPRRRGRRQRPGTRHHSHPSAELSRATPPAPRAAAGRVRLTSRRRAPSPRAARGSGTVPDHSGRPGRRTRVPAPGSLHPGPWTGERCLGRPTVLFDAVRTMHRVVHMPAVKAQ
jgi:hypothetical protein